jgi:NAD(P)-dependent dehydrogenase (short-subunit alcohol dehydrogenase family)
MARTIAELQTEILRLKDLEERAKQLRNSGTDSKWVQLDGILGDPLVTTLDADGARRKLIIFTESRDTLKYLADRIRTRLGKPESVVIIHGWISREDRKKTVEAFKNDKDVLVLVANDAAGEGVNLQRAHLMVNYDLPWNPNRIAAMLPPSATLVHNAGIWPARRVLTSDGLETAFAVNCVGPLLMQQVLLDRQILDRVMVISAGLLVKGRYSAERTPTGLDFSSWRTYCTTKLAFSIAERDIATQHPAVDFVVLHPGVVRTDLGARRGLLGLLLRWMKRTWESPEVCGSRLRDLLERDRWSPPGDARWVVEDKEQPWPGATEDEQTRRVVRDMVKCFLPALRGRTS